MNICVYGAASEKINKNFIVEGESLGREMAKRGYGLVFGGGANGLMGAVARGVKENGGKIIGVIPSFFNVDGVLYEYCDEQIFTETMRIRKHNLEDLSEAFIITPGGVGTFDELFEILTLRSLGRHNKPIVIMNTDGYYDKLLDFLEFSINEGFIRYDLSTVYHVTDNVEDTLNYIDKELKK